MQLPVYHVDAFADCPFTGNPASVVVLEHWLPDGLMQAIAAENNLSETAFVVRSSSPMGLRWFTPRVEVPLCGHATLATAFVLRTVLQGQTTDFAFDTKSGILKMQETQQGFTLDFPAIPATPDPSRLDQLSTILGSPVTEVHVTKDRYLCLLPSPEAVRHLRPDMAAIAALPLPGLIVTSEGDCPDDITSRYFAPAKGVPEDPVTGAAHCVLTPFWAARLGRNRLQAYQASQRGGRILCEVVRDRVLLTGRARLYMRGIIELED